MKLTKLYLGLYTTVHITILVTNDPLSISVTNWSQFHRYL